MVPYLRPHLADRHHAAHGVQEPGRGRAAGARWCCISSWAISAPPAIVAVVIPLSLLATFIGLTIKGIPANLLSLGAMDFGIIVDGAVIVVENVFRRLAEAKARERRDAGEAVD